ncbi:MAG: peptidyl-prolyl cis-trans isomerase [Terriglobia bacterium]|nr:peptidyl-prolyl cis-trans isomerase [Terriglobia bacterium]
MIRFLQTKGRVQQILLIGFLSIICFMMVVTLIPGGSALTDFLGFGLNDQTVAKVGSQEISVQEVQQRARDYARQQYPQIPPDKVMPFIIPQVANMLVSQHIVLNEANRLGLTATNADLRYMLEHGPFAQMLFPNGKYVGEDQYKAFVSNQFNLSVPQFEDELRQQITMDKLRDAIEGGVIATKAEIQKQFDAENVKVKFDYAFLSLDDIEKQVKPSDAELRAYYEKQKPQLTNTIPEKRQIRYVLVDYVKAGGAVTQADLQNYYNQHIDEYRVPETVTVHHILIKTPSPGPDGKVDQKAVDAARAKAEDILKQLKAGANFEALAKKYSEDPGSKDKGGLIGPIRRGQTVPEFEQAAFNGKKGEIVGPVKTSFGFHIIRIDDKTPAHLKSLDEVKPQIEPMLARQKGQAAAEALAKSLQASATSEGLDKAAASKGLQVEQSDYFARGASLPGVGTSSSLMDIVFDAQKTPSTPQAVPVENGWAVVQVTGIQPPSTPTFDQAKAQLTEQLQREKAASELEAKTKELADKAHSEHNLRAAAKAVGATVKTSDFVKPDDQVPDVGQLTGPAAVVFTLRPGEISGPVQAGSNGVVFALVDKQEPSAAEFAAKEDQIRQAVLQRKRSEAIEIYISSLRDKMQKDGKIRINQAQLKKMASAEGD